MKFNKIILLTILFFNIVISYAQNIYLPSNGMPSEVVACGEPASFRFKVFGPLAVGDKIQIDLPIGVEFSALNVSGATATVDVTDPTHPIITMQTSLATASDSKLIKYKAITGCSPIAIDAIIKYTLISTPSVTVQSSWPNVLYPSIEMPTVAPVSTTLNVGQVQATTLSLIQNSSYLNAYTTNAIIKITHSTNIEVSYTATATSSLVFGIPSGGLQTDILTLGSDEILAVGDLDTRLEKNEEIEAIVGIKLLGCPSGAGETITYQPTYGCSLGSCETGNYNTSGVSLSAGAPNLYTEVNKVAGVYQQARPGIGALYGDFSEFFIENRGNGILYNLTFRLGVNPESAVYTPLSSPHFTWSDFTVNGNAVADDGAGKTDFQFTSDPDGIGVGLDDLDGDGFYDDLPADTSIVLKNKITFNHIRPDCGRIAPKLYNVRWSYSYTDQCGVMTNQNVPNRYLGFWIPFATGGSAVSEIVNSSTGSLTFDNATTFDFRPVYTYSFLTRDNITNLHWRMELTLPSGILPNGDASWRGVADELAFISFDAVTGIAIYETSSTSADGFELTVAHPLIPLKTDPACVGDMLTNITWKLQILGDDIDFPGYPETPISNICGTSPNFSLNCNPVVTSNFVTLSDFYFDRTSLGYTDETETVQLTQADVVAANSDADSSNDIRVNRAVQGDNVRYHAKVTVDNATLTQTKIVFEHRKLPFLDAAGNGNGGLKAVNIVYHPAGGGSSITCTDTSLYHYIPDNGADFTQFTYDLSELLQPGKCLNAAGIASFAVGDYFTVDLDFKIREDYIPGLQHRTHFIADMKSYVLTQVSADLTDNQNNIETDDFGIFKVYFYHDLSIDSTIEGCSTLEASASISYSSNNPAEGYLFNSTSNVTEFRSFARINRMDLLVPKGLSYTVGSSKYRVSALVSNANNNLVQSIADPIIDYNPAGYPGFNLYTFINPIGNFPIGSGPDKEWEKDMISANYGYMAIEFSLATNCLIEDWQFSGDKMGIISLPTSEFETFRTEATSTRVFNTPLKTKIRETVYQPLDYNISSSSPTVTVSSTYAEWPLDINFSTSSSSDLTNTWIAITIPSGGINLKLWDGMTQIPLIEYPAVGSGKWWAQLGDLPVGTKSLTIKTNDFTVCGVENFTVKVGQNCVLYPDNPDLGYFNNGIDDTEGYYICTPQEQSFTLNVQEPNLQLTSNIGGVFDLCNTISSNITISNASSSIAYALEETVNLPSDMHIDTTTALFTYNGVDYTIPAAQIIYDAITNTYIFEMSNVPGTPLTAPGSGLPGYDNVAGDPNSVDIKFDLLTDCGYISGSVVEYSVRAKSSCGSYVPTVYYSSAVTITGAPSSRSYSVAVSGQEADLSGLMYACSDTAAFNAHIVNQGDTSVANEFIIVRVPDLFEYVSNSYVSNTGMPVSPNEPIETVSAGFTELKWDVPVGTVAGSVLDFNYELRVKSSEITNIACPYNTQLFLNVISDETINACSGGACQVLFTNGTDNKDLVVLKSDLVVATTSITSVFDGGTTQETVTVNYTLQNTSANDLSAGTILGVYIDVDGSGDYSVGDTLVQNTTNGDIVPANSTISGALTFTVLSTDLCNTILVVNPDDNNCICTGNVVSLGNVTTVTGYAIVDQDICSDTVLNIGSTSVAGYTYTWASSDSANDVYLNDTTIANPTFVYSGPEITVPTAIDYTVTINRGGCPSSTDIINIVLNPLPVVPTGSASQIFCSIDTNTIADLQVTGSNIVWYDLITGGTAYASTDVLVNGQTYYASQVLGVCESTTRLAVTVTVQSVVDAPIAPSPLQFCSADDNTLADVTSQVTGINIIYWDAATLGNQLAESTTLSNGMQVWASQGIGTCAERVLIDIQVNTVVDAPIVPSPLQFCSADDNTLANVTPQVTGVNIIYWDAETLGNQLAESTTLSNGMQVWASQGIGTCAERVLIDIQVNTVVDAPIAPSPLQFCSADDNTLANVTSQVTGINIIYWDAETLGNQLAESTALSNGMQVWASQGIGTCAERVLIDIQVNAVVDAPIAPSPLQFCSADDNTLANVTPQVTGVNIIYWDAATLGNQLAESTALSNGMQVWASQGIGTCAERALIDIQVNAVVDAPTGDITQLFCSADANTVADLIATGVNIVWYADASTTTVLDSSEALVDGESYFAAQGIGSCAVRFEVTVTVYPEPLPTPTGNVGQTFCANDNPTVADLEANELGVIWYADAVGGTVLDLTTALEDGGIYYGALVVGSCESDVRFLIKVQITAFIPVPVGDTDQVFCSLDNPTTDAIVVYGLGIQWYDAASGGANVTGATLVNGITYYATQTIGICGESTNTLAVTVHLTTVVSAPEGDADQDFCIDDNPTVSDIVVVGTDIQYYTTMTGGAALSGTATLVDGTTYYLSQTKAPCGESVTRLAVTVHLSSIIVAPTTSSTDQIFCSLDIPTVQNIDITGFNIQWYNGSGNPLVSNYVLQDGVTYYATQGAGICAEQLAITVHLTTVVNTPTGSSDQNFCNPTSTPLLSDVVVVGTAIQWYDASTGGVALTMGTPLLDGTTYYASQSIGNCGESLERLAVLVHITTNLPLPVVAYPDQYFCLVDNARAGDLLADTTTPTNTLVWYDSSGTIITDMTTALLDGEVYEVKQLNAYGCDGNSVSITVHLVNEPPVPVISPTEYSYCETDGKIISDLEITALSGLALNWYDPNGNQVTNTAVLVAGDYTVTQTTFSGNCESTGVAITINLTEVPPLPVAETVQYFCPENTPVGSDLVADALSGYDLTWAHGDGTEVLTGELLVNGTIYYVSQVEIGGSCPSFKLAIQVVISNPSVATGLSDQKFCSRDNATIGDMEVFSTNETDTIYWYDMLVGGTLLDENTELVQGVTYYGEVVSEQGCVSLTRLAVTIELSIDACDYVANSFTPNGDGVNDTFYIPAVMNYPNFELHIYNRYGNVVYDYKNEGRTSPIWWDGRSRNSLNVLDNILPAATYFYTIYFNDGTDKKPESGWIYLKR